MASLQPVVDLMESKGTSLSRFLTEDPRGKKLPDYLSALSAHLSEDHHAISGGLDDLERHIQHLQDIIRLQQSYSRTIGLTERVNILEVIEHAEALNIDAIKKNGVHVVKHLEPLPKVVLDRQKLLQILTNLISNARQAFHDTDVDPQQIEISLYGHRSNAVRITVSDNGIGIAEENLTRIFQHGFTTRRDGHGFGLHSSAIAASEMNGTLRAESMGPGKGSTFILELPLRTMESENESE